MIWGRLITGEDGVALDGVAVDGAAGAGAVAVSAMERVPSVGGLVNAGPPDARIRSTGARGL